ncbi:MULTISPECIES: hypothetical protein [Pseudoalteromonas]|uniref:ShKT domain-containing protein n=1 Tax=Pseudoalteromonas obscura TaxID=3048491 RepID=A0ABT7ELV2_9GAMM|nr:MULTISPECIES: hypothetical protein [Pseudoalteromonas]MBQ4838024.1 hypothetical protein [Pseudoalteromonas luteoviolacea]MDK2596035.1 hypothetical protein [Pseudoalteromonas sp. P94(2023)]
MRKVLLVVVSCLGISVAANAAGTQSATPNQTANIDGITSATYTTKATILDQLTPSNACTDRCQYEYEACVKWAPPWKNCRAYLTSCTRNCANKSN